MSALLKQVPRFRPMALEDVDAVAAIEKDIYEFPWTRGNFSDSLNAGYSCWVYVIDANVIGYAVLMLAAGEAHVLNLSVARAWQRRGHGTGILRHLTGLAREFKAPTLFLEVRPSNAAARALYAKSGFSELAVRRAYYPANRGHEDAILMGLPL